MKKKIVLCMMLGCLMMALAGCGLEEGKETVASETETAEENEGKNSRSNDEATEETETEKSEESESASGTPVLGGENIEGYDGFMYLYEEIIMSETEENKETGEKERKSLTVYIPDADYVSANGNSAYCSSKGLSFKVELEPYLRYDADDYLPEENLQEYIDSRYDPFRSTNYKDLVINEAEAVGENAARGTVEYCQYNQWEECYYTVFCTYYLIEMKSGETVFVSVEINDSEVTGKTEALIDELEQFYQFEINWDAERAEQKRNNYAANETENFYSTGTLLFELPEGWKEDDSVSTYEEKIYAPDGDMEFAQCMVAVSEEYLGYQEEVDLDMVIEAYTSEALSDALGDVIKDHTAEICETKLGHAAKIVYSAENGGQTATIVMYVIEGNSAVYTLMASQSDSAIEDAVAVLENIIETAQTAY